MGEVRRGTSGHSEALAEESPNFADYANVQSGDPSHTLRMTETTLTQNSNAHKFALNFYPRPLGRGEGRGAICYSNPNVNKCNYSV